MKLGLRLTLLSVLVLMTVSGERATAAGGPPAPTPLGPPDGGDVVVPFTISWSAVSDPSGIVAYNWQVSPSSTFSPVIMLDSTSGQTQATVSGLANGTYFWRVQAVSGAFIQGAWSQAQSFKVTGVGTGEPGTPTLNPPKGGTQFHPWEYITFSWSAVSGAASYVFDASTDPSFPVATMVHINNIPGTTYTLAFGDSLQGNWQARVSAVNANGLAGVPSKTVSFSVFFDNPVPPPPTALAPVGGVTVSLPVTLSWTDVPNPQPGGYEVQISTNSSFSTIEAEITPITPNHYTVLSLTAGTKFWHVRSHQGDSGPLTAAVTAWSTTATFTVNQAPATVTGLTLTRMAPFSGDVVDGQVQLSAGAPPGGAVVTLTSSNPSAVPAPASVTVPGGFAVAPFQFQTGLVTAATPVTLKATLGSSSVSVSLTVQPPSLNNLTLTPSSITGGAKAGAIVMLNGRAPPGGAVVSLASSSPLVSPPATATVLAGNASVSVVVPTSAVTAATTVTVTASWNGGAVQAPITLTPGQPPASLTLSPTTTTGTNGSSGTVALASPATTDTSILLSSSNTAVATVNSSVLIPAGASAGGFIILTSQPAATTTVTISASGAGVTLTATLTVNPFPPASSLSAVSLSPTIVTGGNLSTGTVTLTSAAPSGGATVTLSSSNTAAATVPASVTVAAGATSATFTVTTKAVASSSSATISATFGGLTRTAVLTVSPAAPNADTVEIQLAEFAAGNNQLSVEATSTSSTATLRVFVASTGALIGTLNNDGGGRYRGQFDWPSNPQSIAVKSSLGGSATMAVTLK